eukprot:gene5024-8752_t
MEYISPEGLRLDGRRANEIRRVQAVVGMFPHADGSSYFQQGDTKVVAIVNGPKQPISSFENLGDTCSYLCFLLVTVQQQKKSTELGSKIASTFESAVMNELYPHSQIDISVQVLQADGGVLAVAINAVTLAIIDAGIAIKDFVCAATASVIDSAFVLVSNQLDINHQESLAQGPELTLAILPTSSTIVMNELKLRVHSDLYPELQELAIAGGITLHKLLKDAVVSRTKAMLPALGPSST